MSDDSDDAVCQRTTNDVSTERQTRRQQRDQAVKKRRRIVQAVDSSTEDDLDISNNNKPPTPHAGKSHQTIIQRSATDHCQQNQTSNQETAHSAEFTGSGRPSLIGSGQPDSVNRSVPLLQPAECSGSGRTILTGSGQVSSVNRSVPSVQSSDARFADCFSDRTAHDVGLSNAAKINTRAASDVPTFSLAFDDFLDSEDDDDVDKLTEYTRLRAPQDRVSVLEKPNHNSPDVMSSSQTCRSTVPLSGCTTVSGRPGLFGSGQLNSVPRSVQSKTATWTSYSSAAPQLNSITGSGQHDLTVSQQPTSMNSLMQSEAERMREERIRLSRLKKEEFQRKHASTSSSNQPPTKSASVDTADVKNAVDQTKLQILVDSRELSGAQVN